MNILQDGATINIELDMIRGGGEVLKFRSRGSGGGDRV